MSVNVFPGLSSLLALAAYLLGLSIFVQILQEIYKFLSSTKTRVYRRVLADALGPVWREAEQHGLATGVQPRGPFQFFRRQPEGNLLPLTKETLVTALEQTAPNWICRITGLLRGEVEFQRNGATSWSPDWKAFLGELAAVRKGEKGYWTAQELRAFLAERGHLGDAKGGKSRRPAGAAEIQMPPALLLLQLRRRFLPHILRAEGDYAQIEENFQFSYRRQHLRLTFTLGLLVAILFGFPFETVYQRASSLSPQEAYALAERTIARYEETAQGSSPASSDAAVASTLTGASSSEDLERLITQLKETLALVSEKSRGGESTPYLAGLRELQANWETGGVGAVLRFLFGCLITAVLISFGAPVWNDLAGGLMRWQRSSAAPRTASPPI